MRINRKSRKYISKYVIIYTATWLYAKTELKYDRKKEFYKYLVTFFYLMRFTI